MTELEDYRHDCLRLWMSGFFNDHKFTILSKWSQQWSLYQHSEQRGVTNNLKSRILNEWSQQRSQHSDSLRNGVNNNSKLYNIDWVRRLQARISTIMNEWFLQWPQVTILNEWSQQWSQHPDSLRDVVNNNSKFNNIHWVRGFRHEYPRLWLSGVFNDHMFTVLNEWSQQWSQHQYSLRDVVNNNSKRNNIYWLSGLQARISKMMNEWCL